MIRRQTRDGAELAEFLLTVLRDPGGKTADRITAATWLADRAFGRPTQALEHAGPNGRPLEPARAIVVLSSIPRPERPLSPAEAAAVVAG